MADSFVSAREDEFRKLTSASLAALNERVKVTYSKHSHGSERKHSMHRYVATIQVDKDQDAGKIIAFLVFRQRLRQELKPFHHWMNVASKGSRSDFTTDLFDRCGFLKPRLHGTFGAETDQGEILYIRNVTLKRQHQKQGFGCIAVRLFLQQISYDSGPLWQWWFAVMHNETCEDSWRSAGFRVVNHSCYLASCALKGHICRQEAQPDPPLLADNANEVASFQSKAVMNAVCTAFTNDKATRLLQVKAPIKTSQALHYAAASGKPDWLRWLLKQGVNIDERDAAGNTPAHAAAHMGQLECVRVLLNNKADCTLANKTGYTAMDVCSLGMQYQRECSDAGPTGFDHYDHGYMKVVECFQQASSKARIKTTLPHPRSSLGCTCGECLEGFLSPRMRLRLQKCADFACQNGLLWLSDTSDKWPKDVRIKDPSDRPTLWLQQYIPLNMQRKVTEEFAKGFCGLFGVMSDLLIARRALTAAVIRAAVPLMSLPTSSKTNPRLAEWPRFVKKYLAQGGRVEYVLDAILGRSREESEVTGDGSFLETHDDAEVRLEDLPHCENDDDYTLLLKRLCDDGLVPSGPYDPQKNTVTKVTGELSSAFIDDNIRAYA